jgi:hypothetical protein
MVVALHSLSRNRGCLFCQCLRLCQAFSFVYIHNYKIMQNNTIYNFTLALYAKFLLIQAFSSRSCFIVFSFGQFNGRELEHAKFKFLIFNASCFAMSYTVKICVFVISYDFCLLSAYIPYIKTNI